MASGRKNTLTKQIGEYLVAAELGRLGFVATTFNGNVPDYDIVATDSDFDSILIQVKTTKSNSWHLNIKRFVEVSLDGKKQILGKKVESYRKLIYVMVSISDYGKDRFYVLDWSTLQDLVISGYQEYLSKKNGIRPRNHLSYHTAINTTQLSPYLDNWKILTPFKLI